jgi:eukaryotic-like serine/threonine-protein kinase
MKHPRDHPDIVVYALAATVSVLLGVGVVFLTDRPPSVASGDSSQATAASESARQDGQQKAVSMPPAHAAESQSPGRSPGIPKSRTQAPSIGELRAAEDFDPPPGDGEEHSQEVAFAVDGDPTTTWSTEQYPGGLPGVGKDGVGLAVDAGSPIKASELELETKTPGWSGEVYAANQQARDLAGWGEPVGSISKASADETVPLELTEPAHYYLVWITDLGNGDTVELSEIRLLQ